MGTREADLWSRRLEENYAVTTIDDEAMGLIAPGEHSLLPSGLEGARKVARFFATNPSHTRLLGPVRIGSGVWLAPRQDREE